MGTPDFAVPSLAALCEAGHTPVVVVTAPDKPRGRGQRMSPTAVKEEALRRGIPVLQPESLKDDTFHDALAAFSPELAVVVAFRILPERIFSLPSLGSFNLHASLLPKYRGAAPIQWALINGERESGVTTFFLRKVVDTGNIILQERLPLPEDMTAGELHDALSVLGADVVLRTVRLIQRGEAVALPQDDTAATPAPKITRETCRIDWTRTAAEVHNLVRGLSPYPAAWTTHNGRLLKVHRCDVVEESSAGSAGELLRTDGMVLVQCGRGSVALRHVQQEGRQDMDIEAFLRGYSLAVGEMLGR